MGKGHPDELVGQDFSHHHALGSLGLDALVEDMLEWEPASIPPKAHRALSMTFQLLKTMSNTSKTPET